MDASTSSKRPKGRGRRKIEIKKIENQRKRWVAFSKRKKGLLKKAAQLSMLSGEEIGVIIISEQGRVYTSENADYVVERLLLSQNIIKDDDNDDNDNDVDDDMIDDDDLIDDDEKADDNQGGFWWNHPVDFVKINDGKQSLAQINEDGENLQGLKKKEEDRMKEMKSINCLIDLNEAPDEQFS